MLHKHKRPASTKASEAKKVRREETRTEQGRSGLSWCRWEITSGRHGRRVSAFKRQEEFARVCGDERRQAASLAEAPCGHESHISRMKGPTRCGQGTVASYKDAAIHYDSMKHPKLRDVKYARAYVLKP